ncbi:predicted GPI-anchored protein 58 [Melitaea cinxia]|uniref:predicted GPI-anchored protein 58 n=1 Tax=Melitaea cinxia TaxID=113334 RepID=UPI001E27039A|nr:predicted GPI-anchored protein 58 [Melitaea cinxia]
MEAPLALDIVVEDHSSQNTIPRHSSPALALLTQPEEDTPAPSPSLPLHLPSAPSPSLPPQAPPPPPSLPRTSPVQNSRRQASGSPRSPSTTPRRALLRARRNRSLTPFEHAADLFARIEEKRLEHEEARAKRLHEREMERLRVEAERIEVTRAQNNLLNQLSLLGQQLIDVITQQRPSSS